MANRLQVIDVPVIGLDQNPPDHGGPSGRATTLKDVQVTHYTPAKTAVGGTVEQKVQIEPREAFVSMATALRDSVTGAVDAVSGWANPELLASLGDQLLSVCNGRPRVYNGTTWTSYAARRVVPNKLSQSILHTTNHVLAAGDNARLGNVTCFVWTELSHQGPTAFNTSMVAFRGDDGAWIRTPSQLYQNNNGNALAKVVQDGSFFWVVYNVSNKIAINVYDTHGVLVASDTTTIPLRWTPTPGYWDIAAQNDGAPYVGIIQPHAFSTVGANVGIETYHCTVSGAVITITSVTNVIVLCNGPIAYGTNDFNALPYIETASSGNNLNAYAMSHVGTITQGFPFGAVLAGSGIPDSLTGWLDGSFVAHVAYSLLSNFAPPSGSPNDPGLRYTRSYSCTTAVVVTQTNQVNGLLLASRAFKVDADWYAACYYQGGQGLTRSGTTTPPIFDDATDFIIGDAVQPLAVRLADIVIGSPILLKSTKTGNFGAQTPGIEVVVIVSQASGAITHNAGDSAVAATQTWTLLNAAFSNVLTLKGLSAFNSYLRISGSAHANNNGDFRIIQVVSATVVITEAFNTTGLVMVDDTLAGVTAQLVATTTIAVSTEQVGSLVPPGFEGFYPGSLAYSAPTNDAPANNGTYAVTRVLTNGVFPNWPGTVQTWTMFVATPLAGNVSNFPYIGASLQFTPTLVNWWGIFGNLFTAQDVGQNLVVVGTAQNDGIFPITATVGGIVGGSVQTSGQASLIPQLLVPPLPDISIALADPNQAFRLHVAAGAFDASWLNAYIVISGLSNPQTNGTYQVIAVLSATDLKLIPVDGRTGQRNDDSLHGATVSITRVSDRVTSVQPTWFLMPLSLAQHAAGRWDWGQAYGDWRYDGEVKANTGTFERNGFPLALSSVVASADGKQVVLPYRAQSFTAGQVVTTTTKQTSLGITQQSTVGLKLFDLSASPGLAIPGSDEMLVPGPQASQFSATGVTEDGINVGPERPWLVSQGTTGSALALTLNVTVQYAIAFELLTESGDRVWSTISPVLDVTMRGTVNQNTIAGRMPGPTDRVVNIAIYRTANVNGTPTIQHFKITNDLDVNGTGFSFSSVNGGPDNDTWQFVDSVPDASILSAEPIYTDKGLLQRFPAPAFSQGISGWKARDWLVGYDGAVWMSGEKVEGDAVWYHPAFRFSSFGDDTPVSVCPMDDYLVVHCTKTIWYIPATTFPDATGKNGTLPTPVKLPFTNGGTGFSKELRAGVVYSSSAGGAWLITRDLRNVWLSQPVRDSLTTITGMAIDVNQRLFITTGTGALFVYDQITSAWWQWTPPNAFGPSLITSYQGRATYAASASVARYTPGVYLDAVDGFTGGIVPLIVFSSLNFGGIRSYKRLWACQIVGTYKGPHRLTAVMNYPDDDHAPTNFGPFTPTGSGPYAFEINPMLEEASSFGVTITCDFAGVGTPGNSFALECLSFEIGIDPGLNRNPASRRISGS